MFTLGLTPILGIEQLFRQRRNVLVHHHLEQHPALLQAQRPHRIPSRASVSETDPSPSPSRSPSQVFPGVSSPGTPVICSPNVDSW